MNYRLCYFLFLLSWQKVMAAACCGGTVMNQRYLINDYGSSFHARYTNSNDVSFADSDSEQTTNFEENFIAESLNLGYVTKLSDLNQISLGINYVSNTARGLDESKNYQDLGDLDFSFSRDLWPIYFYSKHRPQIFGTLGVNLGTGKSIYKNKTQSSLFYTGDGANGAKAGIFINKSYDKFNYSLSILKSTYMPTQVENDSTLKMGDRDVYNGSLGFNLNLKYISSVGIGYSYFYQENSVVKNDGLESRTKPILRDSFSLFSLIEVSEYDFIFSYANDSLGLIEDQNSLLNQAFSLESIFYF